MHLFLNNLYIITSVPHDPLAAGVLFPCAAAARHGQPTADGIGTCPGLTRRGLDSPNLSVDSGNFGEPLGHGCIIEIWIYETS